MHHGGSVTRICFFFSIPFLFFSDESFVFLAYKWMFACIYIVKGFEEIFKS